MADTMNPMSSERVLIFIIINHETETMGCIFEAMTDVDISIGVFDSTKTSGITLREMSNVSKPVVYLQRSFTMGLIVVVVAGVSVLVGINNLGMTDYYIVIPIVGILVDDNMTRCRSRSLEEAFTVKFIILEVALFNNFRVMVNKKTVALKEEGIIKGANSDTFFIENNRELFIVGSHHPN